MENIILPTKNTWCPGCGNFAIQNALQEIITKQGKKDTVLVSGIGCHGKMADYLDISSFYSLHGRAIPAACGIKYGNEKLKVICSIGDGDAYNEGIAHLVHAAKRNNDITVLVHDNHAFSLTVKQATSTSPEGFIGSSTPEGHPEKPLNPLQLMLSMKAGFVARGYAGEVEQLKSIIHEAIKHKGFSFVEILQPCIAWYNTFPDYNERVYKMEETPSSIKEAKEVAGEWDYNNKERIPLGVFYKEEKESIEKNLQEISQVDIDKIMEKAK